MAISIKSIETERLARMISEQTGDSITGTIQKALEEKLDRLKSQHKRQIVLDQLRDILQRVDRLPVLDHRTPDEIVGYDERGFPS